MKIRTLGFGLAALAAAIVGCSGLERIVLSAVVADTADYTITSISILPPPAQPGAGTLRVHITYTLNQPGGNVSPIVWLYDDDNFLRFGDDIVAKGNFVEGAGNLSAGLHDGTIDFTLSCDGDEVVGTEGGTGEGYSDLFGINEAEIVAAAQRQGSASNPIVTSAPVDLWCEQ